MLGMVDLIPKALSAVSCGSDRPLAGIPKIFNAVEGFEGDGQNPVNAFLVKRMLKK
jgi:hypothetical protein